MSIAETFNGLMSIPNLLAVFLLSGTVVKLTKEYFGAKKILIYRAGEADELREINKAYLWPWSKVWMRARKASIQTAATKVTNMLYLSP